MKKTIRLPDGTAIEAGLAGQHKRSVIMLPVAKASVYGQEAELLRQWGVDPQLGEHFALGLADSFRVLYFDYEGHRLRYPNPEHLTPQRIVGDFLHIADEMGVGTFAYYGYSWLALAGLQLAIRTSRLTALIMGGFPPIGGPYGEMLTVTEMTHKQATNKKSGGYGQAEGSWNAAEAVGRDHAKTTMDPTEAVDRYHAKTTMDPADTANWDQIEVTMDPAVTKQFVTLYRSLTSFDDRSVQDKLGMPKLAFAGGADTIEYGERFGGVTVDMAGELLRNERELTELGWDVKLLTGEDMNHTKAMQPQAVLPLIKPWLTRILIHSEG